MGRPHRHSRAWAALAFGLLALAAEVVGRAVTGRVDLGRHVATPSYANADYYPLLLAGLKLGLALLLARLTWRFAKARATARAGRRLLRAVGSRPPRPLPRLRVRLSPRLWLAAFGLTSLLYLVETDVDHISAGRWSLVAPWLHTSALCVFAVLAVVVALLWSAVADWLADYESYAEATIARARRLASTATRPPPRPQPRPSLSPRQLFGLAFESRPPPVPA